LTYFLSSVIFIGLCAVVATLVLSWTVFVKTEVPVREPVADNGNGKIVDDVNDDVPDDTDNDTEDDDISKIDTSDWEVYKNEEYGFEMKYPKDFELSESESDRLYRSYEGKLIVELSKLLCCKFSFEDGMDIDIFYSTDKSKYPDMDDFLENRRKRVSKETFSVEKYSYKNFEGVKTISTDPEAYKEENLELFLKTDDGFYSFSWLANNPENRGFTYTNYFIPMLSTFKLTEE